MCGIAGFFDTRGSSSAKMSEVLKHMGNVQAHRGPDDQGTYLSGRCGFVFRRLSIIDLSGGHQPMTSVSGNSVVVFNGEIYNYRELRWELESLGQIFRTSSDTEVILAGYECWGADIVNHLRGMFAFVIYDRVKDELFIARDHTGIKPFYYFLRDGVFVFASEIKALLRFPGMRASFDVAQLPSYMAFLWVPAPKTLFRDIYVLEPGHFLRVNSEGVKKNLYWQPSLTVEDTSKSEQEWVEDLRVEFHRVVREQMVSDVPLGALLSGGIDSTAIVALMNRISQDQVTTFTTGFGSKDLTHDVIRSDLQYSRLAAQFLHIDYRELQLTPDVVSLLPLLIWHMDEPLADPAAITTYLICKAAKAEITVLLSGVGGDEIFGGYPRYRAALFAERYRKIPQPFRHFVIEPLVRGFPAGSSAFLRNARKFFKSASLPFQENYLGYLTYYSIEELNRLLEIRVAPEQVFHTHMELFSAEHNGGKLQRMMNLDLKTFLPSLNLLYTDKMSSASGVEIRVPFLDHLLIEKASQIPASLKISNGISKYILKRTVSPWVPREIIRRNKVGFGAPVGAWLKGQAKEMMLDLLSEETVKKRGYFKYPYVNTLIGDHLSGREYNANQLWQLMTFELWHQTFIDK